MANTPTSQYVDSPVTLRQLINLSYNSSFRSRWQKPIDRKERHTIRVEKVQRWKVHYSQGTPNRYKIHTFRLKVFNHQLDKGKTTNYQTSILLDTLSLDAPVKVRCGSFYKYSPSMPRDAMKDKGICGDFRFRAEHSLAKRNILFGRDMTNGQDAKKNNPQDEVFLCKHLITAIKLLIESGFFNRVDDRREIREDVNFIKKFQT